MKLNRHRNFIYLLFYFVIIVCYAFVCIVGFVWVCWSVWWKLNIIIIIIIKETLVYGQRATNTFLTGHFYKSGQINNVLYILTVDQHYIMIKYNIFMIINIVLMLRSNSQWTQLENSPMCWWDLAPPPRCLGSAVGPGLRLAERPVHHARCHVRLQWRGCWLCCQESSGAEDPASRWEPGTFTPFTRSHPLRPARKLCSRMLLSLWLWFNMNHRNHRDHRDQQRTACRLLSSSWCQVDLGLLGTPEQNEWSHLFVCFKRTSLVASRFP